MIVAFAGKMKSGKDTCAEFLMKEKGFNRIAFADNLKELIMEVFGLSYGQVHSQIGKDTPFDMRVTGNEWHVSEICVYLHNKCGIPLDVETTKKIDKALVGKVFTTPREMLQYIGSEVMRECIHPDIHANVVKNIIDKKGWENTVITDCRFKNEVEAVQSWGGRVIKINRDVTDFLSGNHMSEKGLDGLVFDYTIHNNGTLPELRDQVIEMMG